MNRLDVYYRALRAYREVTAVRECEAFRRAVSQTDTENDRLTVSRNICIVDEDWIEAVEKGLVFVENAIREDRQFIDANGEVVPIERLRRVSGESVRHLARHSNLITREISGDTLIPDKLYNAEKIGDFAVYENRFLYMLLCYLRDFISLRYEKLTALAGEYDGVLKLRKSVVLQDRRIEYTVDLHEKRKDDAYLLTSGPSKDALERIGLLLRSVLALLATPLMELVSKAPHLKPPITKTNVLKMDNDFRGAVALYDYISAYDRPGYTVEKQCADLAPFSEELADELSEAAGLFSFLTYAYGLGLDGELRTRYRADEQRGEETKLRQRTERLDLLKRRLEKREESPEEYIMALENQVRTLQNESRRLQSMRERVDRMEEAQARLQTELSALKTENRQLQEKLSEADHRRECEKAELRLAYEEEASLARSRYREEKDALLAQWESGIREREAGHAEEMQAAERRYEDRLDELEEEVRGAVRNAETVERKLRESESLLAEVREERDRLTQRNLVSEARIKALQAENGVKPDADAFTEKEEFEQLERELEAFVRFYDERWGIAKKAIRKKLLSYRALKEKK